MGYLLLMTLPILSQQQRPRSPTSLQPASQPGERISHDTSVSQISTWGYSSHATLDERQAPTSC